ncbi:MAG: glutamate racemase [Ruminococcaceae bacterium]|nr:glutamate racemase [Oscillospiraceae bacterium]
MCPALSPASPIALFDSGVGGISVLAEMLRRLPGESFIYFGDSANAPYGSRSAEEVCALTDMHVARLLGMDAKAVVIACNTATGAAIAYLRRRYPHIPIIGMEPAVRPAALAHPGGRILVMATPGTLASEKFRTLMSKYADTAQIIPVPCPRLARMIENGILQGSELQSYLTEVLTPHLPADAVVLGCTHYPFVREAIAAAAGTHRIYDGGEGTARETARRLAESSMLQNGTARGSVQILNSDPSAERMEFCRRLLLSASENPPVFS